jgi:hypothetical protein
LRIGRCDVRHHFAVRFFFAIQATISLFGVRHFAARGFGQACLPSFGLPVLFVGFAVLRGQTEGEHLDVFFAYVAAAMLGITGIGLAALAYRPEP